MTWSGPDGENGMRRILVLTSLGVLLLAGPAKAQSDPEKAAASCIASDADIEHLEAREAACLRELGERASRMGNILSLKLDNGTIKTFHSDPEACKGRDVGNKCVDFRLVGFRPSASLYLASLYLLYVTGSHGSTCWLLSARTGLVTLSINIPHFAPDGSTFVITGRDGADNNWLGVGSTTSDTPTITWQMGPNDQNWEFLRWISNDQVALRDPSQDESCPDANCEAILRRAGDAWALERLPAKPRQK
jgi:hypothetical protein